MRILYAVQATGNGHIARAIELVPHLQEYGTVDVFLSGSNASLRPDLPVKFRSKGISLFYQNDGKLDYIKIIQQLNPWFIRREIKQLPVQDYDLVISDFEFISAQACKKKNIPFWHWGHQASFDSLRTPRPIKKDYLAEWILKKYCYSKLRMGFHFKNYEDWILPPVIKQSLWDAKPQQHSHYTVYLPQYSKAEIRRYLYGIEGAEFHVFSKEVSRLEQEYNLFWKPVSNEAFTQSMIHCSGVICGAGFETPAEALFLGKPLMVIPIKGQYEQYANAAALEEFEVSVVDRLDINFSTHFRNWVRKDLNNRPKIDFISTKESVKRFMDIALQTL